MDAERRGFGPSHCCPGRFCGEQLCYLMPVEEKECANSDRQVGLVFKITYAKLSYENNWFTDDFIYLGDENISEK